MPIPVNLVDSLNAMVRTIGSRSVADNTSKLRAQLLELNKLTDDELQRSCRDALRGQESSDTLADHLLSRSLSRIVRLFGWQHDKALINHLALAVASFSRAPADLDPTSSLLPEQIRAAVALTQHSLIQMDTGEGKTYALLPAAFAMACRYFRVYIICANEYLAWRDVHRTLPFWRYVGLTPGLCLDSNAPDEQWSARVVYTTLGAITFRSIHDETAALKPSVPLTLGASLLDETDAILLDQADQPYRSTLSVKSTAFDWTFVTDFAKQLEEDVDVIVDRSELSASLTVGGEEMLRDTLQARTQDESYFLTRAAVENSYVALHVVEEDVHYVVENNTIHPVDPVTSKPLPNQSRAWLPPLEFSKAMPPRPQQLTVYETSPRQLFNSFKHVSGLSGTVADDSLEYFLSYLLPTLIIPPRFRRQDSLKDDLVYKTRKAAINGLVEEVLAETETGRPVLVGTQSIADAQDVYTALYPRVPKASRLHSLTGKNEQAAADIFEQAGELGSVVVATQLAGRGVDIRLSDEARAKGGLALFSLGHALEMRHDKQFLGRAGRRGAPFKARFVCSFEDRLLKLFGGARMGKVIDGIGLEDDNPIESSIITSSIARTQRTWRNFRVRQRFAQESIARLEERTTKDIKEWFKYLQIEDENADHSECASEFLRWCVDHFIEHTVEPYFYEKRVSPQKAMEAVDTINATLARKRSSDSLIEAHKIEDYSASAACQIIGDEIRAELDRVADQRRKRLEETRILLNDWVSLSADWMRVRFLLERIQEFTTASSSEGAVETSSTDKSIADESTVDEPIPSELPVAASSLRLSPAEVTSIVSGLRSSLEHEGRRPDQVLAQLQPIQSMLAQEPVSYPDWGNLAPEIDTILERIASIRQQLSLQIKHDRKSLTLLERRTPRAIAYWRLKLNWGDFLAEREHIRFMVGHEEHTALEATQIILDRVTEKWDEHEQKLAEDLLRDLLDAGQPELLDELFRRPDNQMIDESPETLHQSSLLPPNPEPVQAPVPDSRSREDELIQQFISLHLNTLDSDFGPDRLRFLLANFLWQSPLTKLQTSSQIHEAVQKWSHQEETGRSPRWRDTHRLWLHRFLQYLREIQAIGPLPTVGTRIKYSFAELGRNMRNTYKASAVVGALSFLILFIVGSIFGDFADAKHFDIFGTRLDDLLFGGMLTSGNIMAGCFALPILVYMLADVLNLNKQGLLAGPIPLVFQALLAGWLTNWGGSLDSIRPIQGIAMFVLIFVVLQISRSVISLLHRYAGVDLTLGWLCYTSLFVFVPGLWARQAVPLPPLLVLATAILLAYGLLRLNRQKIALSSERLIDTTSSSPESQEAITSVNVMGSTGARPHVLGVLCAWLSYSLLATISLDLTDSWVLMVAPAVVYLLVLILWTNAILKRRFSFSLWQTRLNSRRERFVEAPTYAETEKYLRNARKQLQWREILAQTSILLFTAIALWGNTLAGTQFPLSLVLLFAAFLFVACSETFLAQLRNLFLSRIAFQIEEVDLAQLFEPEQEDSSTFERVARFLRNRIKPILAAIIAVLAILLNLTKLLSMSSDIVDWVRHLL